MTCQVLIRLTRHFLLDVSRFLSVQLRIQMLRSRVRTKDRGKDIADNLSTAVGAGCVSALDAKGRTGIRTLIMVDRNVKNPTLSKDEDSSVSAEFMPRTAWIIRTLPESS